MVRKAGYPCRRHRIRFTGSVCPSCYKERRKRERER